MSDLEMNLRAEIVRLQDREKRVLKVLAEMEACATRPVVGVMAKAAYQTRRAWAAELAKALRL